MSLSVQMMVVNRKPIIIKRRKVHVSQKIQMRKFPALSLSAELRKFVCQNIKMTDENDFKTLGWFAGQTQVGRYRRTSLIMPLNYLSTHGDRPHATCS